MARSTRRGELDAVEEHLSRRRRHQAGEGRSRRRHGEGCIEGATSEGANRREQTEPPSPAGSVEGCDHRRHRREEESPPSNRRQGLMDVDHLNASGHQTSPHPRGSVRVDRNRRHGPVGTDADRWSSIDDPHTTTPKCIDHRSGRCRCGNGDLMACIGVGGGQACHLALHAPVETERVRADQADLHRASPSLVKIGWKTCHCSGARPMRPSRWATMSDVTRSTSLRSPSARWVFNGPSMMA